MLEQRLIELEIKLAFQEDFLSDLNKIVAEQRLKIADLERISKLLYARIDSLSLQHNSGVIDETPPHY